MVGAGEGKAQSGVAQGGKGNAQYRLAVWARQSEAEHTTAVAEKCEARCGKGTVTLRDALHCPVGQGKSAVLRGHGSAWSSSAEVKQCDVEALFRSVVAFVSVGMLRHSRESGAMVSDETEAIECAADDPWHYGERITVHVMECQECGRSYEHVYGDYEFCPRCGKRFESVIQ